MSLSLISGIPIAVMTNPETGEEQIIHLDNQTEQSDEDTEQLINELLDQNTSIEEIKKILSQKGTKDIKMKKGWEISVLPSIISERVFIAGRAGMGKSYSAKKYIIQYESKFPENEIFLISRHAYDPTYDDVIQGISHMVVGEEMLDYKIDLEDMRDSLVVFDDVDNLQNPKVSKYIHNLVDDLISNGRKYNIYVLYLGHQLSNYSKTRNITNEANKVYFFPGTSANHIKDFLMKKIGIDKPQTQKIMSLKSRWACLSITRPFTIIHEGGVFLI